MHMARTAGGGVGFSILGGGGGLLYVAVGAITAVPLVSRDKPPLPDGARTGRVCSHV